MEVEISHGSHKHRTTSWDNPALGPDTAPFYQLSRGLGHLNRARNQLLFTGWLAAQLVNPPETAFVGHVGVSLRAVH